MTKFIFTNFSVFNRLSKITYYEEARGNELKKTIGSYIHLRKLYKKGYNLNNNYFTYENK